MVSLRRAGARGVVMGTYLSCAPSLFPVGEQQYYVNTEGCTVVKADIFWWKGEVHSAYY